MPSGTTPPAGPWARPSRSTATTRTSSATRPWRWTATATSSITWQSLNQDGSGYGIYAQRYTPTGAVIGGTNEVQQIHFSDGFTGTFRLRWDDDNNPVTPDKLTGPITFNGNAFAAATDIQNALSAIGADANVQAMSLTNIAIVFTARRAARIVGPLWIAPSDIVKTGGSVDAQIVVRTITDGAHRRVPRQRHDRGQPDVCPTSPWSSAGNFVITWTGYGQDGDAAGDSNVYMKTFARNDAYWGPNSIVTTTDDVNAGKSAVVPDMREAAKLVSVDSPDNHLVAAGGDFDGVVQVQTVDGDGSGSLLVGGNWILTAAHVVWSAQLNMPLTADMVQIAFDMPTGRVTVPASQIVVNPKYTGDVTQGNDLALVQLASPAPTGAKVLDIYRNSSELGQVGTLYGYGMIGTGDVGENADGGNLKRTGQNKWDATGSLLGYADTTLVSDFDDGTAQHDAFGVVFGIHNLGQGVNEVSSAHGDSGGPILLDGKIAGIVLLRGCRPRPHDPVPGQNISYGEFSLDTRVSLFADWIDTITTSSGKETLVNVDTVLDANADPAPTTRDNQTASQGHSVVAMDSAGDFVITWTSYGHDGVGNGYGPGNGGENGVYARRYTVDAAPASDVFQVNDVAEGNQQNSRVAMDADGDFAITWESQNQDGSGYDIYAKRYAKTPDVQYATNPADLVAPDALVGHNPLFGPNGEIGGELAINTTTNGDQRYPSVALDDTGDAVFVWSGNGEMPQQQDRRQGVFSQRFDRRPTPPARPWADVFNVAHRRHKQDASNRSLTTHDSRQGTRPVRPDLRRGYFDPGRQQRTAPAC